MIIEIEQEEDGRRLAEVPDLPEGLTYGRTRQEARARVQDRTHARTFHQRETPASRLPRKSHFLYPLREYTDQTTRPFVKASGVGVQPTVEPPLSLSFSDAGGGSIKKSFLTVTGSLLAATGFVVFWVLGRFQDNMEAAGAGIALGVIGVLLYWIGTKISPKSDAVGANPQRPTESAADQVAETLFGGAHLVVAGFVAASFAGLGVILISLEMDDRPGAQGLGRYLPGAAAILAGVFLMSFAMYGVFRPRRRKVDKRATAAKESGETVTGA